MGERVVLAAVDGDDISAVVALRVISNYSDTRKNAFP